MGKWFLIVLSLANIAFGQLSFDRTRVILDAGKSKSQSLRIINNNPTDPYLAQSWIENDRGEKISAPLIALPILQRLEPKQEKQLKITLSGAEQLLSQDQETLFSLNVLGMPPKSQSGQNEVQIIVTNDLKLFYRPKGIARYAKVNGWLYEPEVTKSGSNVTLQNPTPYHLILLGYKQSLVGKLVEEYRIIKPFSTEIFKIKAGNTLNFIYISDQGAAIEVAYDCSSSVCKMVSG